MAQVRNFNISMHYKKYQQKSFKENALCCIAGLCCICILLYAAILLFPLVAKVQEYMSSCIGAINNAANGSYR